MNLLAVADGLKNLSDQQLRQAYMGGQVPQFLVASEAARRQSMRAESQQRDPQNAQDTSIADSLLTGIGLLPTSKQIAANLSLSPTPPGAPQGAPGASQGVMPGAPTNNGGSAGRPMPSGPGGYTPQAPPNPGGAAQGLSMGTTKFAEGGRVGMASGGDTRWWLRDYDPTFATPDEPSATSWMQRPATGGAPPAQGAIWEQKPDRLPEQDFDTALVPQSRRQRMAEPYHADIAAPSSGPSRRFLAEQFPSFSQPPGPKIGPQVTRPAWLDRLIQGQFPSLDRNAPAFLGVQPGASTVATNPQDAEGFPRGAPPGLSSLMPEQLATRGAVEGDMPSSAAALGIGALQGPPAPPRGVGAARTGGGAVAPSAQPSGGGGGGGGGGRGAPGGGIDTLGDSMEALRARMPDRFKEAGVDMNTLRGEVNEQRSQVAGNALMRMGAAMMEGGAKSGNFMGILGAGAGAGLTEAERGRAEVNRARQAATQAALAQASGMQQGDLGILGAAQHDKASELQRATQIEIARMHAATSGAGAASHLQAVREQIAANQPGTRIMSLAGELARLDGKPLDNTYVSRASEMMSGTLGAATIRAESAMQDRLVNIDKLARQSWADINKMNPQRLGDEGAFRLFRMQTMRDHGIDPLTGRPIGTGNDIINVPRPAASGS